MTTGFSIPSGYALRGPLYDKNGVELLGGAGAGSVTSVSIVTANGISGSVATSTTTPAITLNISALDATKIANGTVTSTEFQYLDGVTSAIQTQLDAKQALDADLTTIAGLTATTDNFIVSVASAWASRTVAQVKTTLALNNVDNTSNTTERAATATLTNKRNTPRSYTTTSLSTLTPEIDTYDYFELTAQAAALNIANHSTSTPTRGEKIIIAITSDATPRALTYGTNYVAKGGVALPSTTVASKTTTLGFQWNGGLGKFNLLSVAQEA